MSDGWVDLNGSKTSVVSAAIEVYQYENSEEADWNLVVELTGAIPQLRISGTAAKRLNPEPTALRIDFIDDPHVIEVGGIPTGLTNGGMDCFLWARMTGTEARIEGDVTLEWYPVEWDDSHKGTGPFRLSLSFDAVVTFR